MPIQSFEERTLDRLNKIERRFDELIALDRPASGRVSSGQIVYGGSSGTFVGSATLRYNNGLSGVNANRNYVTLRGNSEGGVFELAATSYTDADTALLGLIQVTDVNSAAADQRIAGIGFRLDGATANNRGGALAFFTKSDGASGFLERARFDRLGRLGIGTNAPDLEIDIESASTAYTGIEINNTDTSARRWALAVSNNAGSFAPTKSLFIRDITGGATIMSISTAGFMALGQGTTAAGYRIELPNVASTSGQGRANAWPTYSSRTRKENIKAIDRKALRTRAKAMQIVEFDWRDAGGHEIGLIAEDVYAIFPEIVTGDINDPASLGIKESKAGILALALVLDIIADLEKSK